MELNEKFKILQKKGRLNNEKHEKNVDVGTVKESAKMTSKGNNGA